MSNRTIRKSVVASDSEDRAIITHLFRLNRRRKAGERKVTFNSYAWEAIKEKMDRDNAKVEVQA